MKPLEVVDLSFFDDAPTVIRSQAFVAAPRKDVFAAIAPDPVVWGEWFPGFAKDGRWDSPAPHGVGSVRTVNAYRQRYQETILAWDADERWAFRVDETTSGMFAAFAEDYRLADEGHGTQLTWTVAFRPNRMVRLAAPLAPWIFRRILKQAATGLTRVATTKSTQ